MNPIARIMIVEDHPLFAASLCDLVSLVAPGTDHVRLESLKAYHQVYADYQPDLVIADLNLPDSCGEQTLSILRSVEPRLPLIIATADEEFIAQTRDDPRNNFWRLDKNSDFQTFVESIADVMITVGLSPSWRLQSSLQSAAMSGLKTSSGALTADEPLTVNQQTLMELVALGLSNKDIARRLDISPDTVKHHLTEIFARFNATSRTQAATIYRRMVATRVAVNA